MTDWIPADKRENMMGWTLHEGTGYMTHLPLLAHAAEADRRIAELEARIEMLGKLSDIAISSGDALMEQCDKRIKQLAERDELIRELAVVVRSIQRSRPSHPGEACYDAGHFKRKAIDDLCARVEAYQKEQA